MDMNVLWQISYGMYAICVDDDGKPTGCIANAMMQVTSENPIFAISLNKDNYTTEVLKKAKRFSLSIISEETPARTIGALGFFSARDKDKMAGLGFKTLEDGLPILLEKCSGYMLFDVLEFTECDTHYVVLAKVTDAFAGENTAPMTYEYYHKIIKGKASKNAPTFQAAAK